MAKQNVSFDASAAVAEAESRIKQAKTLQKEHKILVAQRDKIVAKTEKVQSELNALLVGASKPTGKKRGRPAKNAKAAKAGKAKVRGSSPDGRSLKNIIVQNVLPGKDGEPINRDQVFEGVKAAGYVFAAGDGKQSISQALTSLYKLGLMTRPARGMHTLSEAGEKFRTEARAAKVQAAVDAAPKE